MGTDLLRRQLGSDLRDLRTAKGVTREQAAAKLDCSVSRFGHLENGRNLLRKLELDALMDLYEVPPEKRAQLEDLWQTARQSRRWLSTYRLPSPLKLYVEMEADAATMRSYEGELIPGLLQTEEYARRVHLAAGPLYSPDEIEQFIAARRHRQMRLLDDDEPLNLSVVVSEAAFRRALGDGEIGPAQLAHVVEIAQRSNVTLQVLPFAGTNEAESPGRGPRCGGLHPSMSGSFVVLSFARNVAPPFGYQEHAIGGHIVDDQEIVQRLVDIWELLRGQALSPDHSLSWLLGLVRHTRE